MKNPLLQQGVEAEKPKNSLLTPSSERLAPSSRRVACPICGRTADGDCRISDQIVLCHHGSSKHPPQHLKRGDVIAGLDGQDWALTGDTKDGRAATFTLHKPRSSPHRPQPSVQRSGQAKSAPRTLELARLPEAAPEPPAHMPNGQRITYSSTQSVVVVRDGDNKRHIPHHKDADGHQSRGAGDQPWPLWRQEEAITYGRGKWITEAEGEKCGAWLRAAGLVAVSQPGHDHKPASIERRYALLREEAGVDGVLYLADNDKTGRDKAARCAAAAGAVGLPFVVVHAADVWPDIPEGGSIDDAHGSAAERAAALVAALPTALAAEPHRHGPLTMKEVGDQLRGAITEGVSRADLATLVAELAVAADQNAGNVQRLADAIRIEQNQAAEVRAEIATLTAEADRQEIGQLLSAHYLLPASIATAIEVCSRYLPCDGPSAVLPFLAAVAGLVRLGTEVEASAAAGYRVPVNLFACLVARSGAMKSPVARRLVDLPTLDLRMEMAQANKRAFESWEQLCKGQKPAERPEPPQPRHLHVSEATGEALAHQLQTQEEAGLGLLINRDELSGLFGQINQYRGGRGADEQQLLELFDGGGITSLRVMGNRCFSRSQVSIYGGLQPEILQKLVAKGDASGLWARFLFVPLPERVVELPLETTAEELAEVEQAEATLAKACRVIYQHPRTTYKLTRAAAERFRAYQRSRQHEALRAAISAQSAVYGKSSGKLLRIAGLLHLLHIAAGEAVDPEYIDDACVDRAGSLVDHLDAWALSLHAEVAAGGGGSGLMRTVHKTAEAAGRPINWRDMQSRLSKRQREQIDTAAFVEAAEALASNGFGEVLRGSRGGVSYRSTKPLP